VDDNNEMIKDLCDLNKDLIQYVTKLRSIEGHLKDCVSIL